MRLSRRTVAAVSAAGLALSIASLANAQTMLRQDQVGAAMAFPLISTDGSSTYITVTNVGTEDRNIHFNMIEGEGWGVTDFDCPVTASETVLITFSEAQTPGLLVVECNLAGATQRIVRRGTSWNQGILFLALESHECKDGTCTITDNELFGDFVVVNPEEGFAYSAAGIPFQGEDPLAPGISDRDYHFDNEEYSMFPATLATNFIATGQNPTVGPTFGFLILFVLDGRRGVGSQAALDIVFYDDDETPTSAHYSFDCFSIVPLENINVNFNAQNLGSAAGHVYLNPIDHDQSSNVHDNKFGNGNAIRVVGVHGWIVQIAGGGTDRVGGAWARSLSQGMLPQHLDGSDRPTFDSF